MARRLQVEGNWTLISGLVKHMETPKGIDECERVLGMTLAEVGFELSYFLTLTLCPCGANHRLSHHDPFPLVVDDAVVFVSARHSISDVSIGYLLCR